MNGLDLLAVTFTKGKTTRRRDPYTLHLPALSTLATDLSSLQHVPGNAAGEDYELLFGDVGSAISAMKEALMQCSPCLSLLSIRRGGLQYLAQQGMSIPCLMHHSRHATEGMLMRYLEWGKWALDSARERWGNSRGQNTFYPWG